MKLGVAEAELFLSGLLDSLRSWTKQSQIGKDREEHDTQIARVVCAKAEGRQASVSLLKKAGKKQQNVTVSGRFDLTGF